MNPSHNPPDPPAPPDPAPAPAPAAGTAARRVALVDALLDAALQAQRAGTLDERVREHPRATRWLLRRHAALVSGSAGDALVRGSAGYAPVRGSAAAALGQAPWPRTAALVLRWLMTQLRPDAAPGFDAIPEAAWLQLAGWRPMLAMAAQQGQLAVPDFPRRYRRRAGEPVLDNLCGLWDVGPSTVYRALEKARQGMVTVLLEAAPDAPRRLSLREFVARELAPGVADDPPHDGPASRQAWHRRQATLALAAGDAPSALWHALQAADAPAFTATLQQRAGALLQAPETEALVARMAALPLAPRAQVDLWLARAALARAGSASEAELRCSEAARQVAQAAADPLLLGIVHGALGKFYEPRDADRAYACYQDSAEFLRGLGPEQGDESALAAFVTTYARLAWLYLLRNDERSKAVLDRAEALRAQHRLPDEVLGMLEQVWGEYWRRAGDRARSLEHRFRALNLFERLGDQRSALAACVNIGFDLAAAGDHARARTYSQRVLDAARLGAVDPALVVGARLNIGASWFWVGDYGAAIAACTLALADSQAAGLRLHAFRARYNLAEALYARFRDAADAADETAGDAHIAAALAAPGPEVGAAALAAARQLKATLLEREAAAEPNRLLPGEDAVHVDELAEVRRQRERLALPGDADAHVRAHLAIARAYLAVAAKEREAALALVAAHGLQGRHGDAFEALRHTFERALTREQQLAARWQQAAADLVGDAHRLPLLARLLRDGALSKRSYGALCAVAPATASKHLGLLAARGLLVQRGKGPSTRYELPG